MDVVVVAVRVPTSAAELVADGLFALGASAVGEQPVSGDGSGVGPERDPDVELIADLPAAAGAEALGADLRAALDRLGHPYRELAVDPAVLDTWQDHAVAVTAGRFVLRPVWVGAPPGSPPGTLEVLLDPGRSFGSGSHPTTQACVALLDHPPVRSALDDGGPVLDLGSGSGVLSVAAALSGSGPVTALDVDPAARAATRRSVELNGVAERVQVLDEPVDAVAALVAGAAAPPFSLVLANVLIPVVEAHAADVVAAVRPGAVVVVSGLLESQVDRAAAAFRSALRAGDRGEAGEVEVLHVRVDGDWRTVVFRLGHRPVKGV